MDLENKEEITVEEAAAEVTEKAPEAPVETEEKPARGRKGRGRKQKIETSEEKPQSEWTERVVQISRVTKVVKGGRNMRFAALVVVGDGNGHVGAGVGKAAEIPEAIRKGKEDAMKKLVSVAINENGSITHDYVGKFGSAEVLLKKAPALTPPRLLTAPDAL